MNKSYQVIYSWIEEHMGRDGLCTTSKAIKKRTGLALSTVQAAIKYFKDNKIFDVERNGGHIVFLKDLSKCEHYFLDGSTYYLCDVRYICDDVKYYEPETVFTEPLISVSFSEEGV